MIQKIKAFVLSFSAALILLVPAAGTAVVAAAEIQGGLCQGANKLEVVTTDPTGACAEITQDTTGGFNKVLTKIINIFSVIVGVIAVIMIIVGGFRYIVSGGKQESVTGAKNTILYALIGLIIVAVAQIIVRFVLKNTQEATV